MALAFEVAELVIRNIRATRTIGRNRLQVIKDDTTLVG